MNHFKKTLILMFSFMFVFSNMIIASPILDDHGDSFETATEVTLPVIQLAGKIDSATDKDCFKFVAPETGYFEAKTQSAMASTRLYDINGNMINTYTTQLQEGSTYYYELTSYDSRVGSYVLSLSIVSSSLYGDINEDHRVDSIDYALMKEVLLDESHFPSELNQDAVDLNGDGAVDSIDFQLLHRFLLNKLDVFPRDTNGDGYLND